MDARSSSGKVVQRRWWLVPAQVCVMTELHCTALHNQSPYAQPSMTLNSGRGCWVNNAWNFWCGNQPMWGEGSP